MRRAIFAAFLSIAAIGLSGAGQLAPQRQIELDDQQKADLDRVSAYLNSMKSLQGSFVQIDPNGGIDQGMFYLSKPGKMRFEYQPPNPVLIVSDGSTVAVQNKRLNTVDKYPLWTTPLDLILGKDINLRHNSHIIGVEHQTGTLIVQARSNRNRVQGNITLVFTDPELELRQWTVVDAQGLSTTVSLRDVKQGIDLPDSLFALPEKAKASNDSGG